MNRAEKGEWLLARMGHISMDTPANVRFELKKDYRKWKKRVEEDAQEPGEAIGVLKAFWSDPRFRVYYDVNKHLFETSEAGKAKRRKWNQKAWNRQKRDSKYLEKKKAYDKERYLRRKAAKAAASGSFRGAK